MTHDLAALVTRWTRTTNRRIGLEEGLRGLAWLVIAGVLALALHRLPSLPSRIHVAEPAWLPRASTMTWAAYGLLAAATLVVLGRGAVRLRRRRVGPLDTARRIDRQQGTDDLVATALAVERGTVAGSPAVQQLVHERARTAVARVERPCPRVRAPGRALAGAAALGAVALAMPAAIDGLADSLIADATAAPDPRDDAATLVTPLEAQTRARIDAAIEQLRRHEQNPALRRDARETLATAREQLQRALSDPEHAAASLSRAEQALRQLAKEARREGLFDDQALSEMSEPELTESMSTAMKQGQHDTAAALGRELARRMEAASEPELERMAEAFRERFAPTGAPRDPARDLARDLARDPAGSPAAPGGRPDEAGAGARETAKQRKERWSEALERMAEQMERGESGLSSSEMRRLSEELSAEAERGNGGMHRSLDETLSEIRGARRHRLEELERDRGAGEGPGAGEDPRTGPGPGKGPGAGEGKSPGMGPGAGEGMGPGAGTPGAGDPGAGGPGGPGSEGPPGGRPGPGGGLGRTPYGMDVLPPGSFTPGERVDVPSGGPPKGAVRIIERVARGPGRDDRDYADLHHEYSAVAEAAVRREEIPLTRRDYIHNYFQAVRPR